MYYDFEEPSSMNEPIECFYCTSDCSFPIKPHWHYFLEIIYMLKGCAEMQADNEVFYLSEGDMILFHPKVVHAVYATSKEPVQYAVIKVDINTLNMTPSYAPKLRSLFHYAQKNGHNIFFSEEVTKTMRAEDFFHICITELREKKHGYDLVIRSRIYELFANIIRQWQEEGFCIDQNAYLEDHQQDIYNVTEYIEQHLHEGIQVNDIAKFCGMSYSYFNKKFNSIFGKTCKEYIEESRIHKVEQFLIFTNFDLSYISHETGFSDCSHMIKSFKNYKGITPKKFRMQRHIPGENIHTKDI